MKSRAKSTLICAGYLVTLFGLNSNAHADLETVYQCDGAGNGGFVASSRGMRFTASRDFSVIEFGLEATTLDWYTYDVEVRRSADFTGDPMKTITGVRIKSNGDIHSPPYRKVILPVGRVAVSGEESFTLRIVQTSGPGTSYIESGPGDPDCSAQITVSNQGADVLVAGTPAGFRLLGEIDSDLDGISDVADNCTDQFNADQRDADGDGLGNHCDADLDNDCQVNFVDLGLLKQAFFQTGAGLDADFNGDQAVNFIDLGIMKSRFFTNPGPSETPNLCATDTAYSRGTFRLTGTWSFDLDTGSTPAFYQMPANEVFHYRQSGTEAYWSPKNGGLLATWGATAPTKADCQGVTLSGADISLDTLYIGTWLCALTTDGRVASYKVVDAGNAALNASGWFDIEYVTWD